MPDIFDQIAPDQQGKGDIFDQISPRKDLIDAATGGDKIPVQNWVGRGLYQTAKDVATIPAHFANQFAFNLPRSLANRAGYNYPEAQSPAGNVAAKTAGVIGGLKNPLFKFAANAPNLLQASLRTGLASGAYTPTEDPIALKQRGIQAGVGAALPLAGAGLQKAGQAIAGGFDALKKSAADYVTSNVAPRAYKIYQDAVQKFTPEIQKFAEDKLNIPKSAIDTIKQNGIQNIQKTRQTLNDSTDQIAQGIQKGFEVKNQAVEDAYSKAFSNVPQGAVIHIDGAKRAMGALLRKAGYLNASNKPTALAANDITENSPLRKMMGFYQSVGAGQDTKITAVTPFQWNLFRDALSKSRAGSKGLSGEITGVLDALHNDAEKAGVKGIIQARNLARDNFQAQDTFTNALFKEGKLKNYHNLSEADKRQLEAAQKYIGENFINDLKNVSTGQYVDKLLEYNPERFANDLNKAVDPKWTNHVYQQYKNLLGNDAKNIFDDIVAHRKGNKIKSAGKWAGGIALGGGVLGAGYHKVFGH